MNDIIPISHYNNLIQKHFDNLSLNTRNAYLSDIKEFVEMKNIYEITEYDIISWIDKKLYKNSTYNRKLAALSKVMDIFIKIGMMKYNTVRNCRVKLKVDREVHLNIDEDDVKKVIGKCGRKTSLIIRFLVNTGCRVSEMIDIKKVSDYKIGFKIISINGKGGKERSVYISDKLYRDIRKEFSGDYLFSSRSGGRLNRINLYKQVSGAFLKYCGKPCGCHTLRHFFTTYKIVNEKRDIKAVSKYLGHSNVSTTLGMYVDSSLSAEEAGIL